MDSTFIAEKALGYVQVAFDNVTAVGLGTIPPGCSLIVIQPEGSAIRWRDDGVNPTIAIGQPLAVGVDLRYTAQQKSVLRVIGTTGVGLLNVTFYG